MVSDLRVPQPCLQSMPTVPVTSLSFCPSAATLHHHLSSEAHPILPPDWCFPCPSSPPYSVHTIQFSLGRGSLLCAVNPTHLTPPPAAAEPSISVPAPLSHPNNSKGSPRHRKMLNTLPFLQNGIY